MLDVSECNFELDLFEKSKIFLNFIFCFPSFPFQSHVQRIHYIRGIELNKMSILILVYTRNTGVYIFWGKKLFIKIWGKYEKLDSKFKYFQNLYIFSSSSNVKNDLLKENIHPLL